MADSTKKNIVADYLLMAGAFSLALLYSLRRMSDTDLWGHLKCGEYLYKTGAILKTYYFNSSRPDFPYLNHEWLFQGIIYRIFDFSGEAGLVVLQTALIAASFFILYKILRLYTNSAALISFILSLGILASSHRFALRPQHFSYVFLVYFLFALHMYRRGVKKYAYWLPALMVPWVNIHAESLWGIVVPGVFMAVEYVKAHGTKKSVRKDLKQLVLIYGLILIASLINPFTYKTVIWPLIVMKEQFGGVEELLSPVTPRYLFFWLFFALFVITSALNRKRTDATWFVLSVIYAAVAWTANRGIPHFVFVSSPLIALNAGELLKKYGPKPSGGRSTALKTALIACMSYIIISVVTSPLYLKKYDNVPYPEGALSFLKANDIEGNVFNHHPWGGFIIWNAYPELKPYIDGRFFQKEFYDEFYHILSVGGRWRDILAKYDITIALLPYSAGEGGTLNDRLFSSLNWRLVYWDDTSLVYLRDVEAHTGIIERFGNTIINPDRQLYTYDERSPELIRRANTAAESNLLFAGASYKALLLSADTYFLMGDFETAAQRYEKSLKYSERAAAWVYYRIALCYRNIGDLKKTETYARKCLALAPGFEDARRLLREVLFLTGENRRE